MARMEFDVELEAVEGMNATRIRIPFDVREAFGRARPPVRGTVNGTPYRSTPAVYGGVWFMVIRREIREAAGVSAGEIVHVVMEDDDEPRDVHVPEDLARALEHDPVAAERFLKMSYSHRKDYAEWIDEAKRDETRARRVERALQMIREGKPQR